MKNKTTTHNSRFIKSAFTLAETLIVIGIIGVVAALTLPNLNHATGDKEKVTKVKKIYSSLADAYGRAEAIYGPIDEWFKDIEDDIPACNERFARRITEFMKVSKDCRFGEGCFSSAPLLAPTYYVDDNLNEDNVKSLIECGAYMVLLSDGTSLAFRTAYYKNLKPGVPCKINVDIDGPNKGKNQVGNDMFDFSIFAEENYEIKNLNTLMPAIGFMHGEFDLNTTAYLTSWVIENGNLDYLKCPEELNWETQTSCR